MSVAVERVLVKCPDEKIISRFMLKAEVVVKTLDSHLCPVVLQLCLQQRRTREQLVEQGIMPREY